MVITNFTDIDIVSLVSTICHYNTAQSSFLLRCISLPFRCSLLLQTEQCGLSVCLSVGRSFYHNHEPCKTAEPTEMPFRVRTPVRPRNHVLDGSPDPQCKGAILRGKHYLQGKCLAERARSTILLQWTPSFAEMPDQLHFSCRKLC